MAGSGGQAAHQCADLVCYTHSQRSDQAALARRASGDAADWRTLKHEAGRCAMYDVCGVRPDGDLLNCPTNRVAPAAEGDAVAVLASLCPSVLADAGARAAVSLLEPCSHTVAGGLPCIVGMMAALSHTR